MPDYDQSKISSYFWNEPQEARMVLLLILFQEELLGDQEQNPTLPESFP